MLCELKTFLLMDSQKWSLFSLMSFWVFSFPVPQLTKSFVMTVLQPYFQTARLKTVAFLPVIPPAPPCAMLSVSATDRRLQGVDRQCPLRLSLVALCTGLEINCVPEENHNNFQSEFPWLQVASWKHLFPSLCASKAKPVVPCFFFFNGGREEL